MLGKWWQPPSKELLAAGHEKHAQEERKCLVRSAELSKRERCLRWSTRPAGPLAQPAQNTGEKQGGAKACPPVLTGFGGLLLLGSSHLGPSLLTLIATLTLTRFTDKETEARDI